MVNDAKEEPIVPCSLKLSLEGNQLHLGYLLAFGSNQWVLKHWRWKDSIWSMVRMVGVPGDLLDIRGLTYKWWANGYRLLLSNLQNSNSRPSILLDEQKILHILWLVEMNENFYNSNTGGEHRRGGKKKKR